MISKKKARLIRADGQEVEYLPVFDKKQVNPAVKRVMAKQAKVSWRISSPLDVAKRQHDCFSTLLRRKDTNNVIDHISASELLQISLRFSTIKHILLHSSSNSHITTTMSVTSADYEHWPDDATQLSAIAPSLISGYHSHNGWRECEYQPANEQKKKVKAPPGPEPALEAPPNQPIGYPYQLQGLPPYMTCHPAGPYGYYPGQPIAYPAPAYYGLPQQGYGFPAGYPQIFAPATAPTPAPKTEDTKLEKKEKKSKRVEPLRWQGRTNAEVEEDNMKIAAQEGAYAARKVEPLGLAQDQPVWVVLEEGNCSLRTFAEAKEMKGEWHEDPRLTGSMYFVREQKEAAEKVEEGDDDQAKSKKADDQASKNGAKKKKNSAKNRNDEPETAEGEIKQGDTDEKQGAASGNNNGAASNKGDVAEQPKGGKKGQKDGNGGKAGKSKESKKQAEVVAVAKGGQEEVVVEITKEVKKYTCK